MTVIKFRDDKEWELHHPKTVRYVTPIDSIKKRGEMQVGNLLAAIQCSCGFTGMGATWELAGQAIDWHVKRERVG